MILIDTDICIEFLRGNKSVLNKRKKENDIMAVAFMTAAELYYGVQKSNKLLQNSVLIDEFLLTMNIIHTDIVILKTYGELKFPLNTGSDMKHISDRSLMLSSNTLAENQCLHGKKQICWRSIT